MSGYYLTSYYFLLLLRALPRTIACVFRALRRAFLSTRVLPFARSSLFRFSRLSLPPSLFSSHLYNLRVVVPHGRTDGHRGLSKLLLHGTRENRNTPENSPFPPPSLPLFFPTTALLQNLTCQPCGFASEEPALPSSAPLSRENPREIRDFLKCLDAQPLNESLHVIRHLFCSFLLSKVYV